jgi:hypothetical protein
METAIGPFTQTIIILVCCAALIAAAPSATAAIEPQPIGAGYKDNGINVLLDSAHDVSFYWMWDIRGTVRERGFRVTGSQAALHTVLTPGTLSRMRTQEAHAFEITNPDGTKGHLHRPMVMLPNPEFNVVVTYQFGECQVYMTEEIEALRKFVEEGGGLVMFGHPPAHMDKYPLQALARAFDAGFVHDEAAGPFAAADHPAARHARMPDDRNAKCYRVETSRSWEPIITGSDGAVIAAVRGYGKGRIVLVADHRPTREWMRTAEDRKNNRQPDANFDMICDMIEWASGGKPPAGGDRGVPWEWGGVGGAIFPENAVEVAGVTVLYASNQMPGVLECVMNRTKEVKDLLEKWIPSPPRAADEFYLTPAAGSPGSGWAVNVYTPRAADSCANDSNLDALLSVMAHEIAHTMTGPAASDGSTGGRLPEMGMGLFSEAHAGWFQQKVGRALGFELDRRGLRGIARIDPTLHELDLTKCPRADWGWSKLWTIWEILEYRYGEMWYSNWMKTIHETYKDDPDHELTWQEVVITMSRTVGEDLFPLMKAFGTSVDAPPDWDMPPMKTMQ